MTNDTTVLVVDDQPQNLRLLDAVLSPRGYRVITASSGEHALDTLKVSPIDLILLDIALPGGDGLLVLRRLRDLAATALTPVIVVSGREPAAMREPALEAGAVAYLSKPLDTTILLAEVERVLGT